MSGKAAARGFALVALVAALGACGSSPTEVVFEVIEETTFAPSLGIDLAQMTELPSGVYIEDTVVGAGTALAANDSITIDHAGWLSDGTQFSAGQFDTRAGASPQRLIEGFEIGLVGMAVGGTRRMVIPPALAYGAQGARTQSGAIVVPPGAIVIFEVELIAINP